jgi:hypothetical protein
LAPGHIPATLAPELHFLTAAHSQVRFDVGAKKFCFEVSWQIQGRPPIRVFQRHDGVFMLYL